MDRKIIMGITVGIIAIVAATSLFYVFYVADYTYEDERISIVVPQGTEFNVKAVDMEGNFDTITYNDTSKKNIVVTIMRVAEGSILGMSIKDFLLNAMEKEVEKEGFSSVEITANYTIYKNNGTGRYNVLIKNPEGFNGFIIIGCIGELEDIKRLVESFKFKAYTTEGLTLESTGNTNDTTVNTTNNSQNTQSTTTKQSAQTDYIYLKEGEEAPYHEGWSKQDYIDAGYRFEDPDGVG